MIFIFSSFSYFEIENTHNKFSHLTSLFYLQRYYSYFMVKFHFHIDLLTQFMMGIISIIDMDFQFPIFLFDYTAASSDASSTNPFVVGSNRLNYIAESCSTSVVE